MSKHSMFVFASMLSFGGIAFASQPLSVAWSNPPTGYVDTRQDRDTQGAKMGVDSIVIAFLDPVALVISDIEVFSNVARPQVSSLSSNQDQTQWTIYLSAALSPGGGTVFSIRNGEVLLAYEFRPVDLNNDGVADGNDVVALENALENAKEDDLFDVNRDGTVDGNDLTRLNELLDGTDGFVAWSGFVFPTAAAPTCCCNGGNCSIAPWGNCLNPAACPCGTFTCAGVTP